MGKLDADGLRSRRLQLDVDRIRVLHLTVLHICNGGCGESQIIADGCRLACYVQLGIICQLLAVQLPCGGETIRHTVARRRLRQGIVCVLLPEAGSRVQFVLNALAIQLLLGDAGTVEGQINGIAECALVGIQITFKLVITTLARHNDDRAAIERSCAVAAKVRVAFDNDLLNVIGMESLSANRIYFGGQLHLNRNGKAAVKSICANAG